MKFIAGLVLGLLIVPLGAYLYFTGGSAPVATTDSDMPFENFFARKAQHARIDKEMPKNVPIQPTEANYLAGADLYKQHCAVCHGLPLTPKIAIATGMYPQPPLLLEGKGVTDDEPGESYWKIFNGFRLTGMPGFSKSLIRNADVANRVAGGECRQVAAFGESSAGRAAPSVARQPPLPAMQRQRRRLRACRLDRAVPKTGMRWLAGVRTD